jgi:hypothetical protein
MSEKTLVFLFSPSKKILVAANPKTGSTISFSRENNKWVIAPRNYNQIMGDSIYNGDDWDSITHEKAKSIYKDICPEEEMLKIDKRRL